MSDRTDLFKALNHFMAVLAAYAPGSHCEDVVLEVGDTAFRALERLAAPFSPDGASIAAEFSYWTQAGRVVIRERVEAPKTPARCPGCQRPGVMHTCPEQYGKQSTCAHGYWRGCYVPSCPAAAEKTDHLVTPIVKPCCERDTDGDGNCDRHRTVISASANQDQKRQEPTRCNYANEAGECRSEPWSNGWCMYHQHVGASYANPPEETKPPARAHLKGCALDTDHSGICRWPGCPWPDAKEQERLEALLLNAPEPKSPALSPRQALGEALACLKRASDLLAAKWELDGLDMDTLRLANEASRLTADAVNSTSKAYEAAK